jgi:tetratricopeptide (TPR) repeat protein
VVAEEKHMDLPSIPSLLTPDSGTEDIVDRAPQPPQAEDASSIGEDAACSSAEEEIIKHWPTLDRPHGGMFFHTRRGPLLLLTLALLGGGSWYAMRIGPNKSRALASSGSAVTSATTLPADGAAASETAKDEARSADGQAIDQEARPDVAPVTTEEQVAAATAADGGQAQAPTLGALPPTTEGLGERCRKLDAGGKGRPTAVLAACRPAIAAEPDAADIMVIMARVQIELGRAAEARAWAKKALQAKRDLPEAYVFLGGAEQQMGRPVEARAAYKKYLEIAPAGRHARELRGVLDSL